VVNSEKEINLLRYLIILMKRKKIVIWGTVTSGVVMIVISLLLPKIYRAEARILPPQQSSSMASGQLLGQLTGSSGLSGLLGLGATDQNDLYVGMLKSRTVLDYLVDSFSLIDVYSAKNKGKAREALLNNVQIVSDPKSNIVVIAVEDRDPQRAASLANGFVDGLKRLTKGLAITAASQRRLFFEDQLRETKESLSRAENEMETFQEQTGAMSIEEQAKAVIESIATLRAQAAAKEVELKVMRTYTTRRNPDVQKLEEELNGIKAELNKLEKGSGSAYDPLVPTGRMPSVGTQYLRKLRDLKFDETLYELLSKQYELAKIDEANDVVLIQVVDEAVPPEDRIRPQRTQMVILGTMAGFFLSVISVFFIDYYLRVREDPDTVQQIETLKEYSSFRSRRY